MYYYYVEVNGVSIKNPKSSLCRLTICKQDLQKV